MIALRFLVVCLMVALASPVYASLLFEDDTVLEMELTGPLGSLIENREDRVESAFVLRVNGVDQNMTHDIDVRARGNSRMRVCKFPMLRFDFNKSKVNDSIFAGQNKLKLVSHCRKDKRSEGNVLDEYAAYRILNLLTDVSYRVRLVHMTYTDTDNQLKEKERNRYAFLIEPKKHLAKRAGGALSEIPAVSLTSLDQEQAALVYIFQYLIANTDWSLIKGNTDDFCCHNDTLVEIDSKHYLAPYDFDLAGMVNASYAFPSPTLKIKKVWQRLYRGFCTDHDVLTQALNHIVSKQDEIYTLINTLPLLSDKDKARQVKYLGKFFIQAGEGDLIESFERVCHA